MPIKVYTVCGMLAAAILSTRRSKGTATCVTLPKVGDIFVCVVALAVQTPRGHDEFHPLVMRWLLRMHASRVA